MSSRSPDCFFSCTHVPLCLSTWDAYDLLLLLRLLVKRWLIFISSPVLSTRDPRRQLHVCFSSSKHPAFASRPENLVSQSNQEEKLLFPQELRRQFRKRRLGARSRSLKKRTDASIRTQSHDTRYPWPAPTLWPLLFKKAFTYPSLHKRLVHVPHLRNTPWSSEFLSVIELNCLAFVQLHRERLLNAQYPAWRAWAPPASSARRRDGAARLGQFVTYIHVWHDGSVEHVFTIRPDVSVTCNAWPSNKHPTLWL